MKKQIGKDIIVLAVILAAIFIICRFLPENIPYHINVQGDVDREASKYFLLFGAVIPYSAYWRFFRKGGTKQ